ncbi:MAG: SRPBCC family protein [Phycisphaerales bacterium]|nr:SRPBCC family protein [Phycisphaerales bacterium]
MKKIFKILSYLLLALIAAFLILAATQPNDKTIERSITIKAPQNEVFYQISNFKNWPNWSPWIAKDPSVKLTYKGIDGQVGSSYHWLSDDSGEGEMTGSKLANGALDYTLEFIKPWKGHAEGLLKTEDLGNGETKVTWSMTSHNSFPMRAMGFMLEKFVGNDFETGLGLLKKYAETHPSGLQMSDVVEKELPSQTYATLRKTVSFAEIQKFSTEAFTLLAAAAGDRMSGTASTFYYTWNDTTHTTDMAPAFPVNGADPVKGALMVTIPQSHVCMIAYKGGYSGLGKAHEILGQYAAQKAKKINVVLEEYISGPANQTDSNKWVTNINYLVD